ncbi:hypothetical protein IGI04_007116 [Brassica rapa subsp. trilocularis]|uniref:Uncharacterized protein n=1 Tax=Brassica rapa subsp. trilocularis TaxID=1813537 RepID=A0ABQ7NIT6_BRACM|nr:hypothetical protein IGI04_007116 [Brassica rapa subsp. trilocularis]
MGTNLSGDIFCGGNMRNVCTNLGDVVSFWHHHSLHYLLIALALLDFLGRAFVMVCGECRKTSVLISPTILAMLVRSVTSGIRAHERLSSLNLECQSRFKPI